jgi:hypothetical protein
VRHENPRLPRKVTVQLLPVQGHLSGINNGCHLKATKEDVIRITGVQGAYEFYVDN